MDAVHQLPRHNRNRAGRQKRLRAGLGERLLVQRRRRLDNHIRQNQHAIRRRNNPHSMGIAGAAARHNLRKLERRPARRRRHDAQRARPVPLRNHPGQDNQQHIHLQPVRLHSDRLRRREAQHAGRHYGRKLPAGLRRGLLLHRRQPHIRRLADRRHILSRHGRQPARPRKLDKDGRLH